MRRIAVFGACREGLDVYRTLFAISINNSEKSEFVFLDNDSRLIGSVYEGVDVYSPEHYDLTKLDLVVVGIIAYDRVYNQLRNLNYDADDIVRFYSSDYYNNQVRKVGNSNVGAYSYYKPSTILYNVDIGNYCHIGADCRLGLIGHNVNKLTTYPFQYQFGRTKESLDCSKDDTIDLKKQGKLIIENDVYIGEGVTIMSGLTIGTGSVIGSKTVVTKDVPAFSVVVGSPGKVISLRLNQAIRTALLDSKWWELEQSEANDILMDIEKEHLLDL